MWAANEQIIHEPFVEYTNPKQIPSIVKGRHWSREVWLPAKAAELRQTCKTEYYCCWQLFCCYSTTVDNWSVVIIPPIKTIWVVSEVVPSAKRLQQACPYANNSSYAKGWKGFRQDTRKLRYVIQECDPQGKAGLPCIGQEQKMIRQLSIWFEIATANKICMTYCF